MLAYKVYLFGQKESAELNGVAALLPVAYLLPA